MSRFAFVLCVAGAVVLGWAATASQTTQSAPAPPVELLAVVDGKEISVRDVERKWKTVDPSGFAAMEARRVDMLSRVLDGMIAEQLLTHEAKQRGMSGEDLLKREYSKRVNAVTDEDIVAEYESLRTNGTQPDPGLEVMRPAILKHLTQRRSFEARDSYLAELRGASKLEVRVLMKPRRAEIPIFPSDPIDGKPDAPVTMVLFSDFECPYCRQFEPAVAAIQKQFGDRVRLVWKDFPKSNHVRARIAARAARCANAQNAFFPYRDRLFSTPDRLSDKDLQAYAKDLSLNQSVFDACLASSKEDAFIDDSLSLGQRLGVTGTPTLFVNGRPMSGAVPSKVLAQVISEELSQ